MSLNYDHWIVCRVFKCFFGNTYNFCRSYNEWIRIIVVLPILSISAKIRKYLRNIVRSQASNTCIEWTTIAFLRSWKIHIGTVRKTHYNTVFLYFTSPTSRTKQVIWKISRTIAQLLLCISGRKKLIRTRDCCISNHRFLWSNQYSNDYPERGQEKNNSHGDHRV